MNLHDLFISPLVHRLGWALLHSLWQGAAVAGVVAMILWFLSRASSSTRYLIAVTGLLLSLALPAATFYLQSIPTQGIARPTVIAQVPPQSALSPASSERGAVPSTPRSSAAKIPVTSGDPYLSPIVRAPSGSTQPSFFAQVAALAGRLEPAFPWVVSAWVFGVLGLSLWHLGGWIAAQRLKSLGIRPADAAAHTLLARLARRMNLRRPIRLMQSVLVETPLVLGWLRPVILVPSCVLSGLSPAQLEAILAHELAHIRRHDYLVNLLQVLIETLLFYHPAIWWLSRQVRREREHCCDDLAVQVCGDRLTYATALAAIEEARQPDASLAMAAGGGVLVSRIRRLLGTSNLPPLRQSRSLIAACLAISLVLMPLILNHASLHAAPPASTTQPALALRTFEAPHGIVRDEIGNPIAGTRVVLYYRHSTWGLGNREAETVVTDSSGAFRFTTPLTFEQLSGSDYTDHYVLLAEHPDYAIAWDRIFSDGPKPSYELHLTEPDTQAFRVVDRAGMPVAGVHIWLGGAGQATDSNPLFRQMFEVPTDTGVASAVTDQNGQAIIDNLPHTRVGFMTAHDQYGPAIVNLSRAEASSREIRLTRSARVSGTVRDPQGAGIPGATVVFQVAELIWHKTLVKTDDQGRYVAQLIGKGGFSVGNGGAGAYTVTIQHPDWTAPKTSVAVVPEQVIQDLNIQAMPGVLVKGQVLELGTERPVVGARVGGDCVGGRLDSYTDADGRFAWRVPPGELSAYFQSPPGGSYVMSDRNAPGEHLTLDGSLKEVPLVLHTPSPLGALLTLRGKLAMPDGSPAAGIPINPVSSGNSMSTATGTGFVGSVATDADGTFTLSAVPAGQPFSLCAQTADGRFAAAVELRSADKGPTQDVGTLKLEPTQSADVPITGAEGKPLANTSLKIEPSFSGHVVWDNERTVRTDSLGHLKVSGILPGMQYLLRDARYDRSQSEWLSSYSATVTLIPKADDKPNEPVVLSTRPALTLIPKAAGKPNEPVILSTLLPVRVLDASGKPAAIEDILEISVAIPDGDWHLGPKPDIKQRLDDGWVLIDRQMVVLAHPGNRVTMTLKTGGAEVTATCSYPDDASRLQFVVQPTVSEVGLDDTSGPQDVAKDELAGRVIDPAGKPVSGAVVSFPMNLPNRPDRIPAVVTGDDGVFRFPGFGSQHFLYMQIEKEGFARRWLVDLPAGKGLGVHLDNTTAIEGTVTGPDGKLVPGATITVVTAKKTLRRFMGMIGDLQFSVQTDTQGRFRALVEPGKYELRVSSDGLFARIPALQTTMGQVLDQPVALAPGAHVRVRAIDSLTSKPIAGATLWFDKHLPAVILQEPGTSRTTDEQGMADWPAIMPGRQSLSVSATGYARWECPASAGRRGMDINSILLDLKPQLTEVVIRMEPGMRLTGKVIDPDGKPVARVFVNIQGFQTGDQRYMRPTNANGEFDLLVPATPPYGGQSAAVYNLLVQDPSKRWPDTVSEQFAPQPRAQKSFTITMGKAK